jgi:NADH:ubiquinone oxidoreductase subunit
MEKIFVKCLWIQRRSLGAWKRDCGFYIRARFGKTVSMKQWLMMTFVWWRGTTWGTLLATWLYGQFVGKDEFGNRYYQNKDGSRRWVVYNGTVEASRVTPDWHGWLHFTFKEPPTIAPLKPKSFEKPYIPNLSGTPNAYRPEGSLAGTGEHAPSTADYEAWSPETS